MRLAFLVLDLFGFQGKGVEEQSFLIHAALGPVVVKSKDYGSIAVFSPVE